MAQERVPEIYEEVMQEEDDRPEEQKALGYLGHVLDFSEGNVSFEIETDASGSDITIWHADMGVSTVKLELLPEELWQLAEVIRAHVDYLRRERVRRERGQLSVL